MSAQERLCYMHAGTHKTGSTALQTFIAANVVALAELGVYVPEAGRWHGRGRAHHNVAFQLNADDRFDPAAGTLRDLALEMRDSGAPRVCVTSEDISSAYVRPHLLVALREAFAAAGYRTRPVLYLRPQSDYLESLYPTMLLAGSTASFDELVTAVCGDAAPDRSFAQSLRCDYDDMLDAFERVFGPGSVIVRRYEAGREASWISDDFFGVLGVSLTPQLRATASVENSRMQFTDVGRTLLRNRNASASAELESEFVRLEAVERSGTILRFSPLTSRQLDAIDVRFAAGNRRVAERFGVTVEAVSSRAKRTATAKHDLDVIATRRFVDLLGPGVRGDSATRF